MGSGSRTHQSAMQSTNNVNGASPLRHPTAAALLAVLALAVLALELTTAGEVSAAHEHGRVHGPGTSACSWTEDGAAVERYGGDYDGRQLAAGATFATCAALCCAAARCRAVSFNDPQPAGNAWCKAGAPCCQLKDRATKPVNNTYGPSVRTGVVHGKPAPAPPAPGPDPDATWPVPPYNTSAFVTGCAVDYAGAVGTGVAGDTWPSAWAGNGSAYTFGCDNKQPGQLQMAFMNSWTVSGPPAAGRIGLRLNNDAPVPVPEVGRICQQYLGKAWRKVGNIKPSSLLEVGGVLHAAVQCISYYDNATASFPGRQRAFNAWIITSTDGGLTFNTTATPTTFFGGRLTNPMFIGAGRGLGAAPDEYIYVHFPAAADPDPATAYWDANDLILLGRVRPRDILRRAAYEFWTGAGAGAVGNWSPDAGLAVPVFEYEHLVGQDHTFYNPGLQRYILPNYAFVDQETLRPVNWHGYQRAAHRAPTTQLTLYEAKQPWGPWSLFYVRQPWTFAGPGGEPNGAYSADFPQQWIQDGGRTLTMVASACCGAPGYTYHATSVRLSTAPQPAAPAATAAHD